jgi:hypothetical protein
MLKARRLGPDVPESQRDGDMETTLMITSFLATSSPAMSSRRSISSSPDLQFCHRRPMDGETAECVFVVLRRYNIISGLISSFLQRVLSTHMGRRNAYPHRSTFGWGDLSTTCINFSQFCLSHRHVAEMAKGPSFPTIDFNPKLCSQPLVTLTSSNSICGDCGKSCVRFSPGSGNLSAAESI